MHCRKRNILQSDIMLSFSPQLQQLYLTSNTKWITEFSESEITTGQREIALISWWLSLFSTDDILKYAVLWFPAMKYSFVESQHYAWKNLLFSSALVADGSSFFSWGSTQNAGVLETSSKCLCNPAKGLGLSHCYWIILIACLTLSRT